MVDADNDKAIAVGDCPNRTLPILLDEFNAAGSFSRCGSVLGNKLAECVVDHVLPYIVDLCRDAVSERVINCQSVWRTCRCCFYLTAIRIVCKTHVPKLVV